MTMLQNKIGITPQDIDAMLDEVLLTEDVVLQRIRENCRLEGLPEIEVSVQQGKMLQLYAQMAQPYSALEIGTLGGYSTVCIARGLPEDGSITTIEYDSHHFSVACANFRSFDHSYTIKPYNGDAMEVLEGLRGDLFDFAFIDADKERNADYLQWCVDWCVPGATIIVDNVIREGRVMDPERPEKRDFINLLGSLVQQSRLEATVLQTVGGKTWDGFVLARKT